MLVVAGMLVNVLAADGGCVEVLVAGRWWVAVLDAVGCFGDGWWWVMVAVEGAMTECWWIVAAGMLGGALVLDGHDGWCWRGRGWWSSSRGRW